MSDGLRRHNDMRNQRAGYLPDDGIQVDEVGEAGHPERSLSLTTVAKIHEDLQPLVTGRTVKKNDI